MKRKKIFLYGSLLVAIAAGGYVYREYHRTHKDLSHAKPAFTLESGVLIKAFETDSAAFHQKYTDKVLAVKGIVKRIDAAENPVVIALQGENLSSVQCSMDSTHAADYRSLKEGAMLTVKGVCTGGRTEELFGTDVVLNRCVVADK